MDSDQDNNHQEETRLKIYFLPNLVTAGNLFCGFVALTKIVEVDLNSDGYHRVVQHAIFFILLACIFDLLDGRVARIGGFESPFGREFDSLADIVSFGVAPAFLVHRIVLRDAFVMHPQVGWFIASIYLICGALRLARFNCLASEAEITGRNTSKDFVGFPIPMAAGLVASLTLFLLWWEQQGLSIGVWRYGLPVILLFLSIMMVSEVKYPAFNSINWKTKRSFTKMVIVILLIGFFVVAWEVIFPTVLPTLFTGYLIYGFIRPRISKRLRQRIEEELEDEDEDEQEISGTRG
ncbi:MAG TPA: CDP-diacylglycerol--serine O-phosphatidyltransferase [Verrucomicrobiales bacterium]|jgi:CDP-diacylglycerol--serine O-phosphatidyltransferase|nr:CDP-diacylglycerol--serine O-phosphatidyltransferase [Verrucomicrobiales bacterium]